MLIGLIPFNFIVILVYELRHDIIPPVSLLKSSIKFHGTPGAAVAILPADVGPHCVTRAPK